MLTCCRWKIEGKIEAHKIFNFGKRVNKVEGISPDRDKPLNPLQGDEPAIEMESSQWLPIFECNHNT